MEAQAGEARYNPYKGLVPPLRVLQGQDLTQRYGPSKMPLAASQRLTRSHNSETLSVPSPCLPWLSGRLLCLLSVKAYALCSASKPTIAPHPHPKQVCPGGHYKQWWLVLVLGPPSPREATGDETHFILVYSENSAFLV